MLRSITTHWVVRIAALAIALLAWPMASQAWNKAGHMTSGAIAFDDLSASDPALVDKVVAILRQHPQFDQRWKADVDAPGLSADESKKRLFVLAARWPDDVRGDHDFDEPDHHFIDLPYKPKSQPASVKVAAAPAENLVTAYQTHIDVMRDADASDEDKAVALCWIFHLTGDVHQPLHTISMFTTKYVPPEGDRGGTRFYVRTSAHADTVSLHSVWDNMVIGSERYQSVANKATSLRLHTGMARADLSELAAHPFGPNAVKSWAEKESHVQAIHTAYLNGTLKGSTDKTHGVALPSDYLGKAKPVAERRLVLAGYRLADVLKALLQEP